MMMFPMISTVVWNIRGLNDASKQTEAIQLIRDGGYSICGIIESHVVKEKLVNVCSKVFGKWRWVSNVDCNTGWARVIVGQDPSSVDVMVINQSRQVIHCYVKPLNGQKHFYLSIVYASNRHCTRRFLCEDLIEFKDIVKTEQWAMMGDFNVMIDL